MQVNQLEPGTPFIIPSLRNVMKECVCLRVGVSGTYCKWWDVPTNKKMYEYISHSTVVEIDSTRNMVDVTISEIGETDISGEDKPKRGRKAKTIELVWPNNAVSVAELAKLNDVSVPYIYLKIKPLEKANKLIITEKKKKKGQRGRATKLYQMMDLIKNKKKKNK